MSTNKNIDRICCLVLVLAIFITVLWQSIAINQTESKATKMGYEEKLFAAGMVHKIEIEIEDWETFLENCENEKYEQCNIVIDGETYADVAIRAKGNTSLTSVKNYGNNRYSFKVEFDHYDDSIRYYGLDKLVLNNLIQDNTYMKDYLTYQMMASLGVPSPLCSYVYVTVNGEDWGLYLALEGVEESFLKRNYGSSYGELYKPDSMEIGGEKENTSRSTFTQPMQNPKESQRNNPVIGESIKENSENLQGGQRNFSHNREMNSEDVLLIYTDDEEESYQNIFENAKTPISDADKKRLIRSLQILNSGSSVSSVVDTDEVIRYFVAHNFVCNFDSYTGSMIHNYYLYEENGVLSMIPWDYNLAFGGFSTQESATNLVNYPIDTPVSGNTQQSRPILDWIFASESSLNQYHEIFSDFLEQYFESGYFSDMITQVTEMISSYVQKDPSKFCTYEEFQEGAKQLKEFCELRAESVRKQLSGEIPSTKEGQQEKEYSLLDASQISISAMGSMGMRGNERTEDFSTEENKKEENVQIQSSDFEKSQTGSDSMTITEDNFPSSPLQEETGQSQGEENQNISEKTGEEFPTLPTDKEPPGDFSQERDRTGRSSDNQAEQQVCLTAISFVVLAVGLLTAFFFRR